MGTMAMLRTCLKEDEERERIGKKRIGGEGRGKGEGREGGWMYLVT